MDANLYEVLVNGTVMFIVASTVRSTPLCYTRNEAIATWNSMADLEERLDMALRGAEQLMQALNKYQ